MGLFRARKTIHEHYLKAGHLERCPCQDCRDKFMEAQEAELRRRERERVPAGYPEWVANQQVSRAEARWTVESSTERAALQLHALGVRL